MVDVVDVVNVVNVDKVDEVVVAYEVDVVDPIW